MIPTRKMCKQLWNEQGITKELREHMTAVADFSVRLAEELNKKGYSLNIQLIEAAALLHDIKKGAPHHALAGSEMLRTLDFTEVAPIVGAHMRLSLNNRPEINELTIVFLSDKLFIGSQFVTPEERYSKKLLAFCDNPLIFQIIGDQMNIALNLQSIIENALGTDSIELFK